MWFRIAGAAALIGGLGLCGLAFIGGYVALALAAYVVELLAGLDHAPLRLIPVALAAGNAVALLGAVVVAAATARLLTIGWRGVAQAMRPSRDLPDASSERTGGAPERGADGRDRDGTKRT